MILMDTLKLRNKKILYWLFSFLICGFIAYGAYEIAPSKIEGDWKQVRRSVSRVAEWNSYQVEEIVKGDGIEQLYQNGKIQQQPKQSYFDVRIRLRKETSFAFEAYLSPDMIYLHNKDEDRWVKTDYSHPTAGELIGMSSPINFWLVLLSYVETVEKKIEDGKVGYYMTLRPFNESAHGISFKGGDSKLEIWLEKATGRLLEAKLLAKSGDALHQFEKVEYAAKFTGINQTIITGMPPEAENAEQMK